MTNDIGKRIKHLRTGKKMSQQEFADLVGITRSTISNYETGRRTPHLKDLQRITDALGIGLDYFDISTTDDAFSLITRARDVFASRKVPKKQKQALFDEIMKLYVKLKD